MTLDSCEHCGKRGVSVRAFYCECLMCEQCVSESREIGDCLACGDWLYENDEEGEEE